MGAAQRFRHGVAFMARSSATDIAFDRSGGKVAAGRFVAVRCSACVDPIAAALATAFRHKLRGARYDATAIYDAIVSIFVAPDDTGVVCVNGITSFYASPVVAFAVRVLASSRVSERTRRSNKGALVVAVPVAALMLLVCNGFNIFIVRDATAPFLNALITALEIHRAVVAVQRADLSGFQLALS